MPPDSDVWKQKIVLVGFVQIVTETGFCLREGLLYNPSHELAWPWQWRANNKLVQNGVSLKGMYVWGVNSTLTQHSDYFVWKDTSERLDQRCDDTIDKKRVNSSVLKYFFWREMSNQKNHNKNPEMLSLTRQKFRGSFEKSMN